MGKTYIVKFIKNIMAISNGDVVSIEYEGRLEDGTIFDSSTQGENSTPLVFEIGKKQVIEGFEKEVLDMKINQEKEFTINPEEAYGEIKKELKREIPMNVLPKDKKPEVGMMLVLAGPNGEQFPARIQEVNENNVIIDLNHPLAGKKLIFKIKLLEKK
jgi:FKBP-type peptidyl-prolyl cis-trans isomerase 2